MKTCSHTVVLAAVSVMYRLAGSQYDLLTPIAACRYVLKEMVNPSHGANKETPLFNILKKYWEWEVRR